ncbi:hypothetical protein ACJMK2_042945 [Sinanodonta woodiana]|uniref:Uncharacterized protein n=1 Tax=Sinanodonta woodiana TaxID=1069815 RepID=A0ABD3VVE6_SINWO
MEPMQDNANSNISSHSNNGISGSEKESIFKFPVLILQLDASGNLQRENEELEIDLQNLTIQTGLGMKISQDSFRYAGPCDFTSKATSSVLIVLTYRAFIENHYIFFQSLNEKDAEILETLKQFRSETLQKFQKTPLVDIWKFLPVQPLFSGKIRVYVSDVEKTPEPADEEEYFVITDVESMSLFKVFPQNVPSQVAYFYQDSGPNVVEIVRLINSAEIRIQTNTKQFVIKEKGPHVDKFLLSLRETKSKPKDFLTRPDSILDFYYGSKQPLLTLHPMSPPSTRLSTVKIKQKDEEEEPESWPAASSANAEGTIHDIRLKELQGQMQSALDQFESNEDFQALWIVAETELKVIEESGAVPETEMDSAGLDQNNSEHLCKAFADIEDHIKDECYDIALSRLKACRSVFIYSALHRARDIFREDNFNILKKLFFKRFVY